MQLQNHKWYECSVRRDVLYLICETSQWNTYNQNVWWERFEARTQENHKQDHVEPDNGHCQSGANYLEKIEEGAVILSENRPIVV